MTDTVRSAARTADGPLSGRGSLTTRLIRCPARLVRSIGYAVALVPAGLLAIGNSLLGRADTVHRTWRRLARFQGSPDPIRWRRPGAASVVFSSLVSLALGLLSWFLLMLLVVAVVRGPFYGFVETGPVGPGTWGGPTKAGAWAVHAVVAVPIIVGLPFVLRGLALVQAAMIRRLYGSGTSRLVLPATILLAVLGALLFSSWIQQL
ncbi:hypothetical protein [Kribbella sp. CA-294648]|uniref:hypothetical protein n=1 Tax=Kribbella sp. CA-294648 TaxID=3239948 RepID=UPI003D92F7DF